MKYLPLDAFEQLNSSLSCVDIGDARIYGRLEGYSCKHTTDDRKLKHHIESKYEENQPSSLETVKSPFGPFEQTSRKTLVYLLATLNAAFPDYDFSDVKPHYFTKIPSLDMITNSVHHLLFVHLTNYAPVTTLEPLVWRTIDEAVTLQDCDCYAFNPDKEMEPDSEDGNLYVVALPKSL